MEEDSSNRKYSKISSALKRCFLECLYLEGLTVKEAASRYRLNYSTAKVIIRDLTYEEKKFIKRINKSRETPFTPLHQKNLPLCNYRDLRDGYDNSRSENEESSSTPNLFRPSIEIISRVGFNFFAEQQKRQ